MVTWRCLLAAVGAFLWVAMRRDRKIWLGSRPTLKLLGIGLIAGVENAHLPGLCIALLSALLAAVFLVLNRAIVIGGGDPMVMAGREMVASTVVCLLAVPIFDPDGLPALALVTATDWLWIVILARVCTVFAQALTNRLLRFITAYEFNLAANFEPVYGIIAAALISGEHASLKPAYYAGALAIVLANFLHPRLQNRFSPACPAVRAGILED